MHFVIAHLCWIIYIGHVSSEGNIIGYVGCNWELPAGTVDNPLSPDATLLFWGRSSGGNFLSFMTATNATNYFGAYTEEHYIVNNATKGLIVKDVATADADTYTRSETSSGSLDIILTVTNLTSGDLIDVLTVMYNNESLSVTGDTTVNLALGETATLQASTSEITNAGAPEVVWKDENGNIQSISGTTTHLNFTSTQTGDYSFFVSSVCAADASSNKFTIVVEDESTDAEICEACSVSPHTKIVGWLEGDTNVVVTRNVLTVEGRRPDVTVMKDDEEVTKCTNDETCEFIVGEGPLKDGENPYKVMASASGSRYILCDTSIFTKEGISGTGAAVISVTVIIVIAIVIVVITIVVLYKKGKICNNSTEDKEDVDSQGGSDESKENGNPFQPRNTSTAQGENPTA